MEAPARSLAPSPVSRPCSPSPTQRPPNARQIGPTKWPGTNSKLCARRRRRRLQSGRTRARCSLERDAKMGSTWSAGQNAGPMAAAGSAPRPTGGARGVKRRARRDGLRRRRRRIGGQAQRPPPRPTWSAFDDFACPLLPSRSVGRPQPGGLIRVSGRAGSLAGAKRRPQLLKGVNYSNQVCCRHRRRRRRAPTPLTAE